MSGYPAELVQLDLFDVWNRAGELRDEFDPFRFDHRMSAYRRMIEVTNTGGLFGVDNRDNPLWGLMFQHQWQFRTGRLGDTDGTIDPDAPWGYGNYTLSVIPWLGAVAAGVVADLPVADPGARSRFRYVTGGRVPGELVAGVRDWERFFLLVKETRTTGLEPVRLALWRAHKTCLDVVVDGIARIDPAPYSVMELTFLRGWCRMVDYLWVAAWPTDFGFMTEHGLDVLPERLLEDKGDLGLLPEKVRSNVTNIVRLAGLPKWRYDLNLFLWKRIMRTRAARDDVLPMLDAVFNPSRENTAARRRMLGYLLRP